MTIVYVMHIPPMEAVEAWFTLKMFIGLTGVVEPNLWDRRSSSLLTAVPDKVKNKNMSPKTVSSC